MILPLVIILVPIPLAPGPDEPQARIAGLIELLGDPKIDVRCRAHDALRRLFPEAEPQLRAHQISEDPEVASRCKTLLEEHQLLWRIQGKIDAHDVNGNCMALYLRTPDRLRVGDRLQVTRRDRKVGVVIVTHVRDWGAWVKPNDGTPLQEYERWDAVERFVYSGR